MSIWWQYLIAKTRSPVYFAAYIANTPAPSTLNYDDVGGPKLVQVGCWAHARRKFVDAVKLNPQDAEAVAMVTRMDALFLIDRDARQRELSVEERQAQRRQYAEEWLTGVPTVHVPICCHGAYEPLAVNDSMNTFLSPCPDLS